MTGREEGGERVVYLMLYKYLLFGTGREEEGGGEMGGVFDAIQIFVI